MAADGVEGLARLNNESVAVDAVLPDLRLPGFDCLAVLEAIDDPPPVPVVSAADPFDKRVARRMGSVVVALSQKPVVPTELLDVVAPVVSGEEPRR